MFWVDSQRCHYSIVYLQELSDLVLIGRHGLMMGKSLGYSYLRLILEVLEGMFWEEGEFTRGFKWSVSWP